MLFKDEKKLRLILGDYLYENTDPRRRQELADARMIQEDPNSMANLSGTPIHR